MKKYSFILYYQSVIISITSPSISIAENFTVEKGAMLNLKNE